MANEITQVRLPKGIIEEIDKVLKKGHYTSKSDFIRSSIRKSLLQEQIGSIPNTGDSVKEIRKIREILSKEEFDIDKINSLYKD